MKNLFHLTDKSSKLAIGLLIMLSVFSCQPDETVLNVLPQESLQRGARKQDQDKVKFAKILAKSVLDEDVRVLLKAEALKKFDGDYDVLFQMA